MTESKGLTPADLAQWYRDCEQLVEDPDSQQTRNQLLESYCDRFGIEPTAVMAILGMPTEGLDIPPLITG